MANKKIIIFLSLFITSLAGGLLMFSMPVILYKNQLSSFQISTLISVFALPSVLLGSFIGRLIDQRNKKYIIVFSALLVMLLDLILYTLFESGILYFPLLLLVFFVLSTAFLFFSITTYQYLVPSLSDSESRSFGIWEFLSRFIGVLCGVFGYFYLDLFKVNTFLLLDSFGFFIFALIISTFWEFNETHAKSKEDECGVKRPVALNAILVFILIFSCVVAASIHSIENNSVLILLSHSHSSTKVILLFVCMCGLSSLVSSFFLTRCHKFVENRNVLFFFGSFFSFCIAILTLSIISIYYTGHVAFFYLFFVMIGFIDPFWTVTSNKLMRDHCEGNYAQMHGLIRMPRALSTIIGTMAIGYSIDAGAFKYYLCGIFVVMLTVAFFCLFYLGSIKLQRNEDRVR